MKRLLALSVATVMVLGIAGQVFAGANPLINLALDVQLKSKTRAPGTCAGVPTYASCASIVQVGPTVPAAGNFDIMVVAYNYAALSGIEFGLDWHSTTFMYSPIWTKCTDLEITRTSQTDISTALVWNTCQTEPPFKVVGWFRTVSFTDPGRIDFKTSDQGNMYALDCDGQLDDIHTAHAGFGNGGVPEAGDLDPCTNGPTATESSTWSGVKALYR